MGGRSRNSRKKYRKTKPQRILIRCGFLVGAGGLKEPGSRLPAAASCLGRHAHPAGRSPNSSSLFLPLAAVVAVAQGLFYPPDYSAGRCCSNPPLQPLFKADKTETPVPGSDTGVLGGRGWIARAALLKTAHWAVFALSSATAPQLFESTLGYALKSFGQKKNSSIFTILEFLVGAGGFEQLFFRPVHSCRVRKCSIQATFRARHGMRDAPPEWLEH